MTSPFGHALGLHASELLETRMQLPIYRYREELLSVLEENQIVLLVGETGSGKTTQVPQFLIEAYPYGHKLVCTQPRRVAAMSVAERVAEESDVTLGREVGYAVRFDDQTSPETRVEYCTDGVLLRKVMSDPNLDEYHLVVVDEAHERSLSSDLLLGLLKGLILSGARPDLRVVVMSATLDISTFRRFFPNAPLLTVEGRMFPVRQEFTSNSVKNYVTAAIQRCVKIHSDPTAETGDILVFLTGEAEIEQACSELRYQLERLPSAPPFTVLPLYGALPPHEQRRVFDSAPRDARGRGRKIVVATNIAETSLTIDGVVYVVDSGFVKMSLYDHETRATLLQVTPISRAAANQRMGRAGRTQPGVCYRLYTEESYLEHLAPSTPPEMQRSNMAQVALTLFALNVNPMQFHFVDSPAPQVFGDALELLFYLKAIVRSENGLDLTEHGRRLGLLPVDPLHGHALITGAQNGLIEEISAIVAMLNAGNIYLRPKKKAEQADEAHAEFADPRGDHFMLMNTLQAYQYQIEEARFKSKNMDSVLKRWCKHMFLRFPALRMAENIRSQLIHAVSKLRIAVSGHATLRQVLAYSFFLNTAFTDANRKLAVLHPSRIIAVSLHPSCKVRKGASWYIFNELGKTSDWFIRVATQIDPEDLLAIDSPYFDNIESGSAKRQTGGWNQLKKIKDRIQ